jgi:hypothetical protein
MIGCVEEVPAVLHSWRGRLHLPLFEEAAPFV